MNILLIVEGKTECDIFRYVLPKYGFNEIIIEEPICKNKNFSNFKFSSTKDNIIVIEGPKNRIKDVVKNLEDTDDFYRYFVTPTIKFAGIFLIYDVDHNSHDVIKNAFNKLSDESTGMLLLNCPCVEVLGDVLLNNYECKHFSEYKKYLNDFHTTHNKLSTNDFIKTNFNDILIRFLEKNYEDFKKENPKWEPSNVMRHLEYLIELDKKYNIREGKDKNDFYCNISYFSTALYIFLSFVKGFSRYLNSYQKLLNYLYKIREQEQKEEVEHITKLVDSRICSEKEFAKSINDKLYARKIFREMEDKRIISKRESGKKRKFLN